MDDCPICGEEVDASEALSSAGGEERGLQADLLQKVWREAEAGCHRPEVPERLLPVA